MIEEFEKLSPEDRQLKIKEKLNKLKELMKQVTREQSELNSRQLAATSSPSKKSPLATTTLIVYNEEEDNDDGGFDLDNGTIIKNMEIQIEALEKFLEVSAGFGDAKGSHWVMDSRTTQ